MKLKKMQEIGISLKTKSVGISKEAGFIFLFESFKSIVMNAGEKKHSVASTTKTENMKPARNRIFHFLLSVI
ncbi:hypothetical protein TPHV1_30189 [Treponema phagedenis]|uniref:Uncharacterized protein n=1 Tax=Treponema phagedenis TaxID=162 RepID=A0A0B7GUE0_TREPH|nr:hypothetical protein TPHV1_30189 [Treponema phagedenis]